MINNSLLRRFGTRIRSLSRNTNGVALIEFAFAMPIVLSAGLYGIELSNLAVINLKVSQIALTLADNASRVGVLNNLAVQNLRESDINDILLATRYQGNPINLSQKGRIIVSSLEVNSSGGQWVHWQRCLGVKGGTGYDSNYGVQDDGITGTGFTGMGKPGSKVTAPPGSAVIFVEVNYDYQPIAAAWLVPSQKIQYVASFVVRDRRDLTQVYNPTPAVTPSTCDRHNAEVPA